MLYSVSALFSISAITFSEKKILASILIIAVSFVVGFFNYKIIVSDAKTRNQTGLRLKNLVRDAEDEDKEEK